MLNIIRFLENRYILYFKNQLSCSIIFQYPFPKASFCHIGCNNISSLNRDLIGLEFRAGADPSGWTWQANDFKEHPDTELHLFVAAYNEDSWRKMVEYLNSNNIVFQARDLGRSGWKVILAK